jgi:SAM-dependent methyltransferase
VLEVGCGGGELARAMAAGGHHVVAIDPEAPAGEMFHQVTLEDLDVDRRYTHIVASLSLHHISDLDGAVEKVRALLEPSGTLVLVEFGWERFDDATTRWCVERLPPPVAGEDPGWLETRCAEWSSMAGRGLSSERFWSDWARSEGLHSARDMLVALERPFETTFMQWVPHLYPELDEQTSKETERRAIERREIAAIGLRYVGRARV